MTLPGQTLVTQAQYARLKGRTPLTVFIWIQKGKISPASIINRKIWVERADLDLAKSLMEQWRPFIILGGTVFAVGWCWMWLTRRHPMIALTCKHQSRQQYLSHRIPRRPSCDHRPD